MKTFDMGYMGAKNLIWVMFFCNVMGALIKLRGAVKVSMGQTDKNTTKLCH